MPELPEVETVRRGLEPAMVGKKIERVEQRRPNLRFPFPDNFPERLQGRQILGLGRRAKYVLADLDDGQVLVMHLGMSGSFRIEDHSPGQFHHARNKDATHDHVTLTLTGNTQIVYNDPRRFGFMLLLPRAELQDHKLFAAMGIEPLGNELDGPKISALFAGRKTPLKAALLDQTLIAGLGNIYVCEALFRAGLSPTRLSGTLDGRTARARGRSELLAESIKIVLIDAIAAGGSSLRDHRQTDGSLGYFQHAFRVYGREGEACTSGCGQTIRRIVQSGRSTFYCAKCQK